MSKALIVYGGWEGHYPAEVAQIQAAQLRQNGVEVTLSDTLDAFKSAAEYDLLVPNWTMGTIAPEQLKPLLEAVQSGVGIAGVHGGMGDSFRNETEYQYMVGGQWVAHPGNDGVTYTVEISDKTSPLTAGLNDFTVVSEKYYMHVDPANHVLAFTRFGDVVMPVAWTKTYGQGRVFYHSLGHKPDVVQIPEALTILTRGMLWAMRSFAQ